MALHEVRLRCLDCYDVVIVNCKMILNLKKEYIHA